jgi:hypothetical protein
MRILSPYLDLVDNLIFDISFIVYIRSIQSKIGDCKLVFYVLMTNKCLFSAALSLYCYEHIHKNNGDLINEKTVFAIFICGWGNGFCAVRMRGDEWARQQGCPVAEATE